MIVIQEIITTWSKHARGAPAATQRNAVPEVLPLPSLVTVPRSFYCVQHTAHFFEQNAFSLADEQLIGQPIVHEYRVGCVWIIPEDQHVRVVYVYDMDCGGAPQRPGLPEEAFVLSYGTWGQIIYNGRFPIEYTWIYRKRVCNIGLFSAITSDVFMRHQPDYQHRRLVKLR